MLMCISQEWYTGYVSVGEKLSVSGLCPPLQSFLYNTLTDTHTHTIHHTCCSGCSGSVTSMAYSWVGWFLHTLPWLSMSPRRISREN